MSLITYLNPFLAPINGPLTHIDSYSTDLSHWPDISHARIKRMRIDEQGDNLSVTLYDQIPLLNIYKMDMRPTCYTHKLIVLRPSCLETIRRQLREALLHE